MSSSSTLERHWLVCRLAWGSFLPWYYGEMPIAIIRTWGAYAKAIAEIFSFTFLLKTLLSPWKNIRDPYPTAGFNISGILQTFTLNMVTRLIGAVVRFMTLGFGVIVEICVLALFAVFLILWMIFPLFILWTFHFFLFLL